MCGRYTLTVDSDELVDVFDVPEIDFDYRPRYNIAPTQDAPVLASDQRGTRLGLLRWGLVPFWAEDPSVGNRMINARSETVAVKPSYKYAFQSRRCLVLADGFYEWKAVEGGGPKQPHWIHQPDGSPMGFAGLWECWERGSEPLFTFTILTTEASPAISQVHKRMPVILSRTDAACWLDRDSEPGGLHALLNPYDGDLQIRAVSTRVNSPANDGPELLEPV